MASAFNITTTMGKLEQILRSSKEEIAESKVTRAIAAAKRQAARDQMALEDGIAQIEANEEELLASEIDPATVINTIVRFRTELAVKKEKLKILKAVIKEML